MLHILFGRYKPYAKLWKMFFEQQHPAILHVAVGAMLTDSKLPLGLSYVKQVYRLVYAFRCYRHDSDPICIGFFPDTAPLELCSGSTALFLLCIRKEIQSLYLICLSLPGEVCRFQCISNLTLQFI